jgi:thiol-disulfide isomerase/thioredoxin
MKKSLSLLVALLFAATTPALAADKLGVGDPAPKLEVAKWVKGEPVAAFEKNHVYVVEFWATWCPPCRKSIPHLTELQAKYKDVPIIGVSMAERKDGLVEPFVEKMGDKMDYHVAMDAFPESGRGPASKNWMTASGQGGIPTAFIVNGKGVVAWIGSPFEMDEPLDKIVAGKWDLDAAVKLWNARQKVSDMLGSHDTKGAIKAIDEALALDASLEQTLGMSKYKLLIIDKDYGAAYAYASKLIDGVLKDSAEELNGLAWSIVDPDNKALEKRDLKVAMKAAARANDLSKGTDPAILDTLAKVHFDSGEIQKAVELQQKAVDLAEDSKMKADLSGRLEEYKKASGKPKG